MRRKRKQESNNLQNFESYTPCQLPKNAEEGHVDLSTFITPDYTAADEDFVKKQYHEAEKALDPIIQTGDPYTLGTVADGAVDAQMKFVETKHSEEVAMHEISAGNIVKSREVRKEELERRISALTEKIDGLNAKIEPLKDKHTQFVLHLGKHRVSVGLVVTILAMAADALMNFSFLQGILLQNSFMLWLCVLGMSIMSDGTMYGLGELLSRKDEQFMPPMLRRIVMGGLIGAFALSVVASVMIRFGSMNITFGSINSAGEFVGKASYSAAEWGVALITAFLTTTTGLLSLGFSVDHNGYLESRRLRMEAEAAHLCAEREVLLGELSAIKKAPDPMIRDLKCRKAAEANIEALRIGLKIHVRKLLAQKQQNAAYTDAMAESAAKLLAETGAAAPDSTAITNTINLDPQLKEAV